MGRSLLGALVNIRSDTAPPQRVPQFHAKEAAGRVTRHVRIISGEQTLHHLRIGVDDFGRDRRRPSRGKAVPVPRRFRSVVRVRVSRGLFSNLVGVSCGTREDIASPFLRALLSTEQVPRSSLPCIRQTQSPSNLAARKCVPGGSSTIGRLFCPACNLRIKCAASSGNLGRRR